MGLLSRWLWSWHGVQGLRTFGNWLRPPVRDVDACPAMSCAPTGSFAPSPLCLEGHAAACPASPTRVLGSGDRALTAVECAQCSARGLLGHHWLTGPNSAVAYWAIVGWAGGVLAHVGWILTVVSARKGTRPTTPAVSLV